MINEIFFLSIIFLSGSIFAYVLLKDKHAVYALGFIIGSAVQIVIGTFLIMTGFPVSPVVNVLLVFLVSIVCFIFRKKLSCVLEIKLFNALLFTLVSVFVISIVVYSLFYEGWAKYTNDSFEFLDLALVLAGRGGSVLGQYYLTSRLFGPALLQLPATAAGELYLRAVFPLLGISVVLALLWFVYRGCCGRVRTGKLLACVILSGLLLISNNRFIFHSFYIHSHMVCAAMVLTVSACGWLMIHDKKEYQNGYLAIISVALFALIVSRAESVIIGIFALIPLISDVKTISIRQKQALLFAFGIPTTIYYGFVILTLGGNINADTFSMGDLAPIIYCLLGILVICLAFLLKVLYNLKLFAYLAGRATIIAECGLWLSLLIYYITDPWLLRWTITAFYSLFVAGEGAWGLSVVFLIIITLLILSFIKNPDSMTALRFPVTVFMPIMMISTHLQGGAPRAGPGGSFNRMFIQIVPLVVLFIIMSIALGESRFAKCKDLNEEISVDEEKSTAV